MKDALRHSEAAFETVIEHYLLDHGYIPVGTDFNETDQLFFDQIVEAAMKDDDLIPFLLRKSINNPGPRDD